MKNCIFTNKNIFLIYPNSIGYNFLQEKTDRPEGLDFNQIFIVMAGKGELSTPGGNYEINAGDMFFIKKNTPHTYCGTEDFTTSFLGFDGKGCESIFSYYNIKNYGVYTEKNYKKITATLKNFYESFDTDESTLSANTYSTVLMFFGDAFKKTQTPIEKVRDYIDTNFRNPITLNDILEFYPYSKAKLCREFSNRYGMTVFDAVLETRLLHAKYMLEGMPDTKLKNVAESCGFNDTSYFCKMYKRKYGTSPKSNA